MSQIGTPQALDFWLLLAVLLAHALVVQWALWRIRRNQGLVLNQLERLRAELRQMRLTVPPRQMPQPESTPPVRPPVVDRVVPDPDSVLSRRMERENVVTPAPFDARVAAGLYRDWCTNGRRNLSSSVKASAMALRVIQSQSELLSPTLRFVEKDQIGDFVRLSSVDAQGEGYLFPHPDSAFNPSAHPRVFHLTAERFSTPADLKNVEPLKIRRVDDSEWEVA